VKRAAVHQAMVTGLHKWIVPAAVISVLGLVAWIAQGEAQTIIDSKGTWQIAVPADAQTSQDKFSLSTSAFDQAGAKLSLSCRKDVPLYYFAIENLHAVPRRSDEDARFSIRVPHQEPIWFQTAWRADGGINIQEKSHQTAFSIIFMLLTQSGATTVQFLIGDQQLIFSLDGFADLAARLREPCGYDYASQAG
jgi:hypothetical protein